LSNSKNNINAPLITIKDLGRKYVIGAETAFKICFLNINKGEFVALMGPLGSENLLNESF
jgi:putative ABC transport system ATP-binding protein